MPKIAPYKSVYGGARNTVYEQQATVDEVVRESNWIDRQLIRQSFFKKKYRVSKKPFVPEPEPGEPPNDKYVRGPWAHGDIDMTLPSYFMLGTSGSMRAVGGTTEDESLGNISGFFNDDRYDDNFGSFRITFFEKPPGQPEVQLTTHDIGTDNRGQILIPTRNLYTYRWTTFMPTQVFFANNGLWKTDPDGVHEGINNVEKTNQYRTDAQVATEFIWALVGRTPAVPLP